MGNERHDERSAAPDGGVTGLRFSAGRGVLVVVAPSALVLAAGSAGAMGRFFLPEGYEPSVVSGLLGLLAAALIGLSASLVHELGHATVARASGFDVDHIRLGLFASHVRLTDDGRRGRLAGTALSGPAANLVLAAVVWALPTSSAVMPEALREFAIAVNLVMALNLLPAMPLDGGQAVRALVTRSTGSERVGTRVAGAVGSLTGLGLAGWLLWPLLTDGSPSDPVPRSGVVLVGLLSCAGWLTAVGLAGALTAVDGDDVAQDGAS